MRQSGLATADPIAGGERVDGGGVDGVGVEVEIAEPHVAEEPRTLDGAHRGAAVTVVALGEQQLGEEPGVGQLLLTCDGGDSLDEGPHRGEADEVEAQLTKR